MNNDIFRISAVAVSHPGKVRQNNEDNLYFAGNIMDEDQCDFENAMNVQVLEPENPYVFAVFDGMGGMDCGERASFIAAEELKRICKDNHLYPESGLLSQYIDAANTQICNENREKDVRMGSTLSILSFWHDHVWICNVGDSPILLYRDGKLTSLHKEHTEREIFESIPGYIIAPGKKFPLTQHLGIEKELLIITPYENHMEMKRNDIYLIGSDGLTDMVKMEEIAEILDRKDDVDEKIRMLRDKALEMGGKDNITIICIQVA